MILGTAIPPRPTARHPHLEELFGRDLDGAGEEGFVSHDFFYGDPNLVEIQSLEAEGKARLYFTGVAMNLLNLRPEICAPLLVEDEEWVHLRRQGMRAWRPYA